MMVVHPGDPHLSLDMPVSVQSSSTIVADLNYGDSTLHGPIYGICAYIDYDPNQVDENSFSVDFSGSFLDSINVSNLITWWYADVSNDRIIIVEARKDQLGMGGYGMNLAHISFQSAQGYTGALTLHISQETKVMANRVTLDFWTAYGNVQNIFKVNTDDATTQVSLGIQDGTIDHSVSIFPSPAKDFMHLKVNNVSGEYSLRIMDVTGRVLLEQSQITNNRQIDLRSLPGGYYLLQVEGKGWRSNSKLVVGE